MVENRGFQQQYIFFFALNDRLEVGELVAGLVLGVVDFVDGSGADGTLLFEYFFAGCDVGTLGTLFVFDAVVG